MRIRNSIAILGAAAAFANSPAHAKVQGRLVDYRDGATVLQGYLASDDSFKGKRPGVLVIHEWMGQDEYVQSRARQLAALGYVAFAPDIYGKGVRPKTREEAGKQAGIYRADRPLMRRRAQAGLQVLAARPNVDARRLAAMGYCFGGGTALELARSGAPIRGAISFHGNLDTPNMGDANNIKGRILVLHGADDPTVKPEQIAAFHSEMKAAKVPYKFIAYPGAVHGFTNPKNGADNSRGVAYNASADRQSWAEMKRFFAQVFAR